MFFSSENNIESKKAQKLFQNSFDGKERRTLVIIANSQVLEV